MRIEVGAGVRPECLRDIDHTDPYWVFAQTDQCLCFADGIIGTKEIRNVIY